MSRRTTRLAAAALGLALLADPGLAAQSSGGANKTYSVSDVKGLVKAIGPDRTVVLRKGDYRLSSGYGTEGEYAAWRDAESGKELYIEGVRNLTIRGADGARIIGDSASAYLLCLSGCENVALDNLRLSRDLLDAEGDSESIAGGVYAESTEGLVIDRLTVEGPTGTGIELLGCPGARVRRAVIRGALQGPLSIVASNDVEVSGSKAIGCEGYPLVYVEDSDPVLFASTRFEDCSGGNFIEIYSSAESVESVAFSGCEFSGVAVDFFCGTGLLPSTEECAFEDSSFDESWPENSVAYVPDASYDEDSEDWGDELADEGGPAYYAHRDSGLGFAYPGYWGLEEAEDLSRVGLFAPDGESLVLFVEACAIPEGADLELRPEGIFADAAAALMKTFAEGSEIDLAVGPEGEPSDESGIWSAVFSGEATTAEGRAAARVRLLASEGSIYALVALAKEGSGLEPGSEADGILASAEYAPRGD